MPLPWLRAQRSAEPAQFPATGGRREYRANGAKPLADNGDVLTPRLGQVSWPEPPPCLRDSVSPRGPVGAGKADARAGPLQV